MFFCKKLLNYLTHHFYKPPLYLKLHKQFSHLNLFSIPKKCTHKQLTKLKMTRKPKIVFKCV